MPADRRKPLRIGKLIRWMTFTTVVICVFAASWRSEVYRDSVVHVYQRESVGGLLVLMLNPHVGMGPSRIAIGGREFGIPVGTRPYYWPVPNVEYALFGTVPGHPADHGLLWLVSADGSRAKSLPVSDSEFLDFSNPTRRSDGALDRVAVRPLGARKFEIELIDPFDKRKMGNKLVVDFGPE